MGVETYVGPEYGDICECDSTYVFDDMLTRRR